MFSIRSAEFGDVGSAVSVLGDAFDDDPLMPYFFRDNADGVHAAVVQFFSILLRARIALGMPAYVLHRDDDLLGAVMGYDTSRPAWPAAITEEWRQFEAGVPGFTARLAAYEAIADLYQPRSAHSYIGVIGVHPSLQGQGAGKAMLDVLCEQSRADPRSNGVYLETASHSSLRFYLKNGFEVLGEGNLDTAHLWCVYKPT